MTSHRYRSPDWFWNCWPAQPDLPDRARGLRVDWAANRLATTDEPIAQIADRAGFNDQSHLTRSMRARLGATPLEWRQSARRGPSAPPEKLR